jgi:hypothetical protein
MSSGGYDGDNIKDDIEFLAAQASILAFLWILHPLFLMSLN